MLKHVRFLSLVLLLSYAPADCLQAQLRLPFAPAVRARQLIAGPTVLVVATRPGQEDFDGMARLRLASGARLAFVYVTNGESVPSEIGPWTLPIVAARRKEEALKSASAFDARAFFLNLPDDGCDSTSGDGTWTIDSLTAALARTISTVKPHLVLLATGSLAATGDHHSGTVIAEAVRRAAVVCAEGSSSIGGAKPSLWRVQTIAEAHTQIGAGVVDTPLLETSRPNAEAKSLAARARSCYASLPLAVHAAGISGVHYRILEAQSQTNARFILGGIDVSTPRLSSVKKAVAQAGASLTRNGLLTREKAAVAMDSVYACIRQGLGRFSELDQRALILWKGDLDYFQSKEFEKFIYCEVSDSIVTERQVFFVRVRLLRPDLRRGTNQILFHTSKKDDWVVNETKENLFDLNRDSLYRILSPERLDFNTPVALYGLEHLTLEEPFRFSIIHQGKTQAASFILTKEVALRYSSRHASVLRTPIVPIAQRTPVVLDSYNFTRDEVDAELFVKDSLCWSDTLRFTLTRKDEHRTDTLFVRWVGTPPAEDWEAKIRGGNHTVATITGRPFTLPPSGSRRAVLVSARAESPFDDYFPLIHMPFQKKTPRQFSEAMLANADVLVIDRDTPFDFVRTADALKRWIENGGRLVVLPQFSAPAQPVILGTQISFLSTDPLPGAALKAPGGVQASLHRSNGVVRGFLAPDPGSSYEALVSRTDGKCVLARKTLGRGEVILSAIDLDAWIGQGNPAGYDIMAHTTLHP